MPNGSKNEGLTFHRLSCPDSVDPSLSSRDAMISQILLILGELSKISQTHLTQGGSIMTLQTHRSLRGLLTPQEQCKLGEHTNIPQMQLFLGELIMTSQIDLSPGRPIILTRHISIQEGF